MSESLAALEELHKYLVAIVKDLQYTHKYNRSINGEVLKHVFNYWQGIYLTTSDTGESSIAHV